MASTPQFYNFKPPKPSISPVVEIEIIKVDCCYLKNCRFEPAVAASMM